MNHKRGSIDQHIIEYEENGLRFYSKFIESDAECDRLNVRSSETDLSKCVPTVEGIKMAAFGKHINFLTRNALSRGMTRVLVGHDDHQIMGCYSFHVRAGMFNSKVRDLLYIFDYYIFPDYRSKNLAKYFNEDAIEIANYYRIQDDSVILTGSTGKTNVKMHKVLGNKKRWRPYTTQTQYSWRVASKVPVPQMKNIQASVKWVTNRSEIIDLFQKNFHDFQFRPSNFADMFTDSNMRLIKACCFVEIGKDTVASMTLWDQDKLQNLINTGDLNKLSHNQIFGAFAQGPFAQVAFDICLASIHNRAYEERVNILFAGIQENDPISAMYSTSAIVPKPDRYKTLEFFFQILTPNQEDHFFLDEPTTHKTFSDPRDYGGIIVVIDQPAVSPSIEIIPKLNILKDLNDIFPTKKTITSKF